MVPSVKLSLLALPDEITAAFNWLMFTASVSAIPFATLAITLPPALMPAVVMLGPPVTVKPAADVTVPANVGASTTLYTNLLVAASYVTVVFLPSAKLMFSSFAILSFAPAFALTVNVPASIVFVKFVMLVVFVSTFVLVACN